MRKNIFQILEEEFDIYKEVKRINEIFESNLLQKHYSTIHLRN